MIKTVIFDMDGVIIDTEPVHNYAFNVHFNQLNIVNTTEETFGNKSLNSSHHPSHDIHQDKDHRQDR